MIVDQVSTFARSTVASIAVLLASCSSNPAADVAQNCAGAAIFGTDWGRGVQCGVVVAATGMIVAVQEYQSVSERLSPKPIEQRSERCSEDARWPDGSPAPVMEQLDEHFNAGRYCATLAGYAKLAEAGNTDAQLSLGLMYERGYGVEVNPEKAAELYRAAQGR